MGMKGLKDSLRDSASLARGLYTCSGYAVNENLKGRGIPFREREGAIEELTL
jgi:hypothetical protein